MSGRAMTMVVVLDGVTAAAYLGTVFLVARGLLTKRRPAGNRLALATVALFLAGAAHHTVHGLVLLTGGYEQRLAMTHGLMGGLYITVAASTAVTGLLYLGFLRSSLVLRRSGAWRDSSVDVHYRELAANLPNLVLFVLDTDLRFLLAEGAGLADAGYDREHMVGRLLVDVLQPESFAELSPYYRAAVDGAPCEFDRVSDVTGKTFHTRARPLNSEAGRAVGVLVVAEDVTDARAKHAELVRARAFNEAVVVASPDITSVVDLASGELVWTSRSVWGMLGWPPGQGPPGGERSYLDLVPPEDLHTIREANAAVRGLADGESVTMQFRLRGEAGTYRWVSRRSTPFTRDDAGTVVQGLSVLRDITDVVQAEESLQHRALHDPLTGLPNRVLVLDRITSSMARAERAGTDTVVLFCDLDEFKRINDTDGHAAGDAVLVEVAHRLQGVLRQGDSIARVGGDEFVIVLDPTTTSEQGGRRGPNTLPEPRDVALLIAERIRSTLVVPIDHDGRGYVVCASVGVSIASRGMTAENVLREADTAMYQAKQRGKNRAEIFDEAVRADTVERSYIELTLRASLDPESTLPSTLTVAYQPVYDLDTGRLVSFEALARLRDASGTTIPPDEFIPVAEDTGLISALGVAVLDAALAALVRWRTAHPADTPATMAVNLSARQAQHASMPDVVLAALSRHGLAPRDLVLELTESVLLESGSSTLRQLTELHVAGVGIAIDDFGTGYASLHYLATLPVTSVKVDRSFTAAMTTDRTSATIVRAIVGLAADLELDCIVEGIETDAQLEALPAGVHGQGYLLGRPGPEPDGSWLREAARRHQVTGV